MKSNSHALNDTIQDWHLWPILNEFDPDTCEFEPLEQGLTNENWLVTLPPPETTSEQNSKQAQQFVIRINAKNVESLNIHHEHEYEIVESINALKLCPSITYNDPNFTYWVRPFISGQTLAELNSDSFTTKNLLSSVAKILKTTHSQAIKSYWPSVDIIERSEYFWDQLLQNPSINKQSFTKLKLKLDIYLKPNHTQMTLCHMDTNLNNWILDNNKKLHLIDWEYAGLGNPVCDLAVFSDSAKLTTRQEEQLLESYGEYTLKQLHQAKLQMEYLSILWFAVQESTDSNTLHCELKNLAQRAELKPAISQTI